ncbi:hypothetical protein [Thermocladium modestius]|nr:hypothetical protein [Thermocladium modestius]
MSSMTSYTDFTNVEKAVAEALWNVVKESRGSCVSFIPKTLLERSNNNSLKNNMLPVVFTLVKHILDVLTSRGLLEKDDSRSVIRYKLCKTSELWALCKESDNPDKVEKLIRDLVE